MAAEKGNRWFDRHPVAKFAAKWGGVAVAAATVGSAVTSRLTYMSDKDGSYNKSNSWEIDVNIPVLHGRLYFSPKPFTPEEQLNVEGFPKIKPKATPATTASIYKPNVSLTPDQLNTLAQIFQKQTNACPDGATTVPYTPQKKPENSAPTTTIGSKVASTTEQAGQIDLRVCYNFAAVAVKGSAVVLPLMPERRPGIGNLQMGYPADSTECAQIRYDYAFKANAIALAAEVIPGVSAGTELPIDIIMNANQDTPCGSDLSSEVPNVNRK